MRAPLRARKNLGESAERVAALYLEQRGYRILARNFRTRAGEIDIVAEDGDGLAFVEVKARRGSGYGTPEEAITLRKQARLVRLVDEFLARRPDLSDKPFRVDVVAMELDRGGKAVRIDLIKNAVER